MQNKTCDIFCTVVDNYGDIGVSWRLAKQLAKEHGWRVRLWVDDLHSFSKLCPDVEVVLEVQHRHGVEVRRWTDKYVPLEQDHFANCDLPKQSSGLERIADLVIEAFACKLSESYVEAMAGQKRKPVWINLEYLSAEDWVEAAHKLPSPHLRLSLTKHFFFPGFTQKTGGLLLERDLLLRRDAFQKNLAAQQSYWRSLYVPERAAGELRVSLFSYENEAIADLLQTWAIGSVPVVCCVPEGRVLPQVIRYFAEAGRNSSRYAVSVNVNADRKNYTHGSLSVHVLPFVEQERYDELLWACDINFVRGEDSCVRAQWAGKPFVWQIYPQHDGVHLHKLNALCVRYGCGLSQLAYEANERMWQSWNGEGGVESAWQLFIKQRDELEAHTLTWSDKLKDNNLAENLSQWFCELDAASR